MSDHKRGYTLKSDYCFSSRHGEKGIPHAKRLAGNRFHLHNKNSPVWFLSLTLLAATAAHSQEWLYTVRPGDNLWNVTADYLTRIWTTGRSYRGSMGSPTRNTCRRE